MYQHYYSVISLEEALHLLAEHGEHARIVAGATDLILEIERRLRPGITALLDITRVPNLDRIFLDEDDFIHLGPLVTHNHCVASRLVVERAFPLARAAWEVGAPQIRNRGTVAGNLITASPANDTITPLIALDARLVLRSLRGERTIPLAQFYTGVRRTVMQPDEILVDIFFPALKSNQRGTFIKLGLRRAQAIALVNAAVVLTFDQDRVEEAAITLGAVAPTIIHAPAAEAFLAGRILDPETIETAASLAMQASRPISDVRASLEYRYAMTRVCVLRCLRLLAQGTEREGFPEHPVLLWGFGYQGAVSAIPASLAHAGNTPIVTTINGKPYTFSSGHDKTLLRLLREDAGLIGTKEGCAEGECGACTVFLDGMAVMSCLVPAPRAHGAHITTVEGLAGLSARHQPASGENVAARLHPVQQAFIDAGAVQCGYCTPGFLMSAAMLLEENLHPNRSEIQQAITGNLCRCTGYYKIVEAIEKASHLEG